MATIDVQKLVRNSALVVKTFTSDMSTDGHTYFSTGIGFIRQVSTLASTMTTDDANLYVPFDIGDRIGFVVGWGATAMNHDADSATGVSLLVKAGSGPRSAWQRELGDYTLTMMSNNTSGPLLRSWIIGPFEDSRFGIVCDASSDAVGVAEGQKFAHLKLMVGGAASCSATGTATTGVHLSASVLPFRWPDVQYDT